MGKRLKLATADDPVLRAGTRPVKDPAKIRQLVADMLATMPLEGGVGLAAPQVGRKERVFVTGIGPQRVFINPEIISRSLEVADFEGCLSLPRLFGEVNRSASVIVRAQDLTDRMFTVEAKDLYARILQHEQDHLDGVLFADHVRNYDKVYEVTEQEWDERKETAEPDPGQNRASRGY